MRIPSTWILALATLFALLVTVSACASDQPPVAPTSAMPAEQSTDDSEPRDAPVVADAQPAEPDADSSASQVTAEPQSVPSNDPSRVSGVQIMRLTAAADLFRGPSDDWLPERRVGPHTLLMTDGYHELVNGTIWLRLDLNADQVGWVRLSDSPLTRAQAQQLPAVDAPPLPTIDLTTKAGETVTVTLVGRLPNSRRVALRPPGAEAEPVWVERRLLPRDAPIDALPTYVGPLFGKWSETERFASPAFVVVGQPGLTLYARPQGPPMDHGVAWGEYPVLGRSIDGAWIALLVDQLAPPVVWIPLERVDLPIDPNDIPIMLSSGFQIFQLSDEGGLTTLIQSEEPDAWRWVDAATLLVFRSGSGTSLLDLATGEERWVTEHNVYDVSPDGAYALRTFIPESDRTDGTSNGQRVMVVSLENGDKQQFEGVYRPMGRCGSHGGPVTLLRWSPDSRWLLSMVHPDEEGERSRTFALSVLGEQIEILTPDEDLYLYDWRSLYDLELAGVELRYVNSAGEQVERPWSVEMLAASVQVETQVVELPDGWWSGAATSEGPFTLAHRSSSSEAVGADGFATLPSNHGGWTLNEFGLFDSDGNLLHSFRSFGIGCGTLGSRVELSPDGRTLVIGTKWLSCA